MNKIDNYLLEHIELSEQMIFEIMGVLKESHVYNSEIAKFILYSIKPYFENSKNYKDFKKRQTDNCEWDISEEDVGVCSWFTSIQLQVKWIRNERRYCTGGYNAGLSVINENGFKPVIHIIVRGNSEWAMLDETLTALSHELLHAYEDYRRKINGYKGIGEMSLYMPYRGYLANYEESEIAKLLYRLVSFERHAYLSELYVALVNRTKSYQKKELLEALKDTEIYKIYVETADVVSRLRRISTPEEKQKVVDAYNKAVEEDKAFSDNFRKATDFKEILVYILRQWRKFDRKWKQNVNKTIYDILDERLLCIR